jgi:hypothetical protein
MLRNMSARSRVKLMLVAGGAFMALACGNSDIPPTGTYPQGPSQHELHETAVAYPTPDYWATAKAEYPQPGTPWPTINAGKVYPTVGPIQRIDDNPLLGTPSP